MEKFMRMFSLLGCIISIALLLLFAHVPLVIGTFGFLGMLFLLSVPREQMPMYREYVIAPALVIGLFMAERADLKAHGIHAFSLACSPHLVILMVLNASALLFTLTTLLVALCPEKFDRAHVADH
jgi:hypothetical protein